MLSYRGLFVCLLGGCAGGEKMVSPIPRSNKISATIGIQKGIRPSAVVLIISGTDNRNATNRKITPTQNSIFLLTPPSLNSFNFTSRMTGR